LNLFDSYQDGTDESDKNQQGTNFVSHPHDTPFPEPRLSAVLFFEDFESGLGQWETIGNGVIVADPLKPNNQALSFTKTWGFGDILSKPTINVKSGRYVLTFDYLGTCSDKNCGGFIGYEPGDVWLGGTDISYPGLSVQLPDTGRWERVTIFFSGPPSIQFQLEDWYGFDRSALIAGDAYFDNILLTDDVFGLFLPVISGEK
jgi:hypothetical protein